MIPPVENESEISVLTKAFESNKIKVPQGLQIQFRLFEVIPLRHFGLASVRKKRQLILAPRIQI